MSDSLCNSCAAPMCRWLLKMEICKGMEVAQEDRVTTEGDFNFDIDISLLISVYLSGVPVELSMVLLISNSSDERYLSGCFQPSIV